ncbi:hypothetical protein [Mariniluteicoccus flavus]
MDLSKYLTAVDEHLANATALADDNSQQVAKKLGSALEPALRLALIEAVADAAAEIGDVIPGGVEVRMDGLTPRFTVTEAATDESDDDVTAAFDADADEELARVSLRLPQSVKAKIDELAAADGLSANAWLTHAAMVRIARVQRRGTGPGFGPGGPGFGPGGPGFGPGGPGFGPGFGPGRRRGGRRGPRPEGFETDEGSERRGRRGRRGGWGHEDCGPEARGPERPEGPRSPEHPDAPEGHRPPPPPPAPED